MPKYQAIREVVIQTNGGPQHVRQGEIREFDSKPSRHWEALEPEVVQPSEPSESVEAFESRGPGRPRKNAATHKVTLD